MEELIIDNKTIEYIGDCISDDGGYWSFEYMTEYERVYLHRNGSSFRESVQIMFEGKTVAKVIYIINNSNLSDSSKIKIIQYVLDLGQGMGDMMMERFDALEENMMSDTIIERLDKLEKLIECQNDRINILIDALDLVNNSKK